MQGLLRSCRARWAGGGVLIAALLAGCSQEKTPSWVAYGREAMVATDHPLASQIGADVLRRGGNAVDAAVAVSFALAVTRPQSTGLGGGGFLIYRDAQTGEVAAFDYRECAPARATAAMFAERAATASPQQAPASRYGHVAVAVPGQVAGLAEVLEGFGTMPWAELIDPAIALAEQGFAVDAPYVSATETALERYREYPHLQQSCPYIWDTHVRHGRLHAVGENLRQPALGRLLRALQAGGADAFYRGAVADELAQEMAAHGGLIDQGDLAAYTVARREPLRGSYRGYEIVAMPPVSSGGVCLLETLNALEHFDLPTLWLTDPDLARHYFVEAMKHAFADRARWLGDADFAPVPVDLLISKAYAGTLAAGIAAEPADDLNAYGAVQIPDDSGTSHFSIVDRWGNCVVSTETVNTEFGSLAAVGSWGLILNNEMDDFTAIVGEANAFGLTQSTRNTVAPGKRPLSSMTPTIVLDGGEPFLLLGASGGPRIISSVLNVLVSVLDAGSPLPEAVDACRLHHQWRPNQVFFDSTPPDGWETPLRRRGHDVAAKRRGGVVQAIVRVETGWCGVSDPRKQGSPAGY